MSVVAVDAHRLDLRWSAIFRVDVLSAVCMLFISSGDDDAHACPFALTMILLGVGEGERQQLGENYFFFCQKGAGAGALIIWW